MDNAPDQVKTVADYITLDVTQSGWEKQAIEKEMEKMRHSK